MQIKYVPEENSFYIITSGLKENKMVREIPGIINTGGFLPWGEHHWWSVDPSPAAAEGLLNIMGEMKMLVHREVLEHLQKLKASKG